MVGQALDDVDNVALHQLQVGNRGSGHLIVRGLATGHLLVVLGFAPVISPNSLGVLANGGEVAVDLPLQTGGEAVAQAVLDGSQLVDGGGHLLGKLLVDGGTLVLLQSFLLEHGDAVPQRLNRGVHIGIGAVSGIHQCPLGIGNKVQHKLLVQIIQQVVIQLIHRHLGQCLSAVGQIIGDPEKSGSRTLHRFLLDLLDLTQQGHDLTVVGALFGGGGLALQLVSQLLDALSLIVDHILVNRGHRQLGSALYTVGRILGGVLLQLEGQSLDIRDVLHSRLIGCVVSGLQFHMLELKLVELLALGGDLGGPGLVVGGLDHGFIEDLQIAVEVAAALLLAGLALKEHGLGELTADLYDGVQAGHGVLEDHGDLVAADLVELLLRDLQQILAVIDDLTALGDGVGGLDAHDGLGSNGLAGAGLTHDGQGLTLGQVEADVTHSLDLAVGGAERNAQVTNL